MNDMVYVAEDPRQPGAAFAITLISPRWQKDTAETLADWVKRGAIVRHVTMSEGMEMIGKWVRPGEQATLI